MSSATRPARLSRAARREHFLDVAADLVSERGVDAVTMEGVAAAAGVSKGLGYAYFENAAELLQALLQRELADFERRVADAIRQADGFEGRIRAAVHGWFDVIKDRGHLLGPLLQAGQTSLAPHRSKYYRRLEEIYGRMAETELGVPRKKAVAASAILIAGMAGLLERWVECGDSPRMLEDTFVTLAMSGLRGLVED